MGSGHEPRTADSPIALSTEDPSPTTHALYPGEVHLWYAVPARCRTPELLARYESFLSPDERARWKTYRFERHRLEYLVTRALVRSVLSSYAPLPPSAWRFTRNAFGRPELDPRFRLRFSLANAPTLVACAVSRDEVGVDVEPLARGEDVLRVAASVLSPRENAALLRIPRSAGPDHALTLWTLKEAFVKARGRGLSMPVEELTFTVDDGSAALDVGRAFPECGGAWHFRILDRAGHRLAVAAESAGGGAPCLRVSETIPLLDPVSRV